MCQFSSDAKNSRESREGESLIVTESPHQGLHWVTEPGLPNIAVCIFDKTILAVEVAPGLIRGARFEVEPTVPHYQSDRVVWLDKDGGSLHLNRLPLGASVHIIKKPVPTEDRPVIEEIADDVEVENFELATV